MRRKVALLSATVATRIDTVWQGGFVAGGVAGTSGVRLNGVSCT
jgi:hypothetical protein